MHLYLCWTCLECTTWPCLSCFSREWWGTPRGCYFRSYSHKWWNRDSESCFAHYIICQARQLVMNQVTIESWGMWCRGIQGWKAEQPLWFPWWAPTYTHIQSTCLMESTDVWSSLPERAPTCFSLPWISLHHIPQDSCVSSMHQLTASTNWRAWHINMQAEQFLLKSMSTSPSMETWKKRKQQPRGVPDHIHSLLKQQRWRQV